MPALSSSQDPCQQIKYPKSGNSDVKAAVNLMHKLYAIDKVLASTPLRQQADLQFDQVFQEMSLSFFEKWTKRSRVNELNELLQREMPLQSIYRFVWAYEKAYKTALAGRHYANYDRTWAGNACSDVIHILPKVDSLLGTKLHKKFGQIVCKLQPFRFLDLPIHLRINIYRHLLVSSDTIAFADDISHDSMVFGDTIIPRPHTLFPALLRTCRQLNTEATPVLDSYNTFLIRSLSCDWTTGGLLAFAKMSPAHRALIFKLELQLWHPHKFIHKTAFVKHKASLPSMTTLLPNLESCIFLFYENFSQKMRYDRESLHEVIQWNMLEAPPAKFVGWDLSFQDKVVVEVLTDVTTRNGGWREAWSEHWKNHGAIAEKKRQRGDMADHEGYRDDTVISRDFASS